MSETKLRVGSVGGLGGRENSHAGGYRRCPEANLVAVADINHKRLQQFGDEWEIPRLDNVEKAARIVYLNKTQFDMF